MRNLLTNNDENFRSRLRVVPTRVISRVKIYSIPEKWPLRGSWLSFSW